MPKPLSPEYLAGLFDGEGCVNVYETRQGRSQVLVGNIEIANSHAGVIARIHAEHGGHYRVASPGRLGRHKVWVWRIGGQMSVPFARLILPHAIIKHEQLELFLEIRSTVKRAGRTPVPAEIWARRRKLLEELQAAKRSHLVLHTAQAAV